MKRLILLLIILMGAGGTFLNQRHQVAQLVNERERLRGELDQINHRSTELEAETALLEAEATAREQALQRQSAQATAEAEVRSRAEATNSFGPSNGAAAWSEAEAFVWIEKKHLAALDITAFRASDRIDVELTPDAARLLNQLGRQFIEAHPELADVSKLTPEKAAEAQSEYAKLLTEAAAGVDGKTRQALENAIRQAEDSSRPGAMGQPPAEYRLNENAVTLLAMTAAERGTVEQVTSDMVERYHEYERHHVTVSDDHALDSSGPHQERATFKVTAFAEEGGALKAEWLARLNATLGADRAQHLLQMSGKWLRSDLGDLGEAERVITLRDGARSAGYTESSTKGHYASVGTGGPPPIPPGWRHLIVRPAAGGLPQLRLAE